MIKNLIVNVLPKGLYNYLINRYRIIDDLKSNFWMTIRNIQILRKNKQYKNIHSGKRCFILCSGPSVRKQNLKPLKNEIVFCVSTGFLHEEYKEISPKYHCFAQFTYDHRDIKFYTNHFKEMDAKIISEELFFNVTERELIEKNNLFKDKKVNYVYLGKNFNQKRKNIYSIDKVIPRVQTVSIMVIIIAMYMGFKEIYLIGTDHDAIITRKYNHAFKNPINETDTNHIGESNTVIWDNVKLFRAYTTIFEEYRYLNQLAKQNNVQIYNATLGGILDEFERVELSSLFKE